MHCWFQILSQCWSHIPLSGVIKQDKCFDWSATSVRHHPTRSVSTVKWLAYRSSCDRFVQTTYQNLTKANKRSINSNQWYYRYIEICLLNTKRKFDCKENIWTLSVKRMLCWRRQSLRNVHKMGLLCCCFRPKVFKSERKRILDDRIGNKEGKCWPGIANGPTSREGGIGRGVNLGGGLAG